MNKRVAIVTGSSSGFGLLCVIQLAKANFHVIATMRDVSKSIHLVELAKKHSVLGSIDIHQLDVTSNCSIQTFNEFLSNYETIDVLVNNAGVAIGGFVEELSVDDFRTQFETNFFGAVAVTKVVLPFMRKQKNGKIINMSSISGLFGFPGLSPYAASKFALEGFSESLRLEMKPFGVDVVLIEPGSYQTNIWSQVKTISNNISNESAYFPLMKAILDEVEKGKKNYGKPQEVANLVAKMSIQNDPALRYPIGKGVWLNILLKKFLPWKWLEKIVMNTLLRKN